ncbi:MAG: hypothetical protein KDK99_18240 [Verrucomicrobiales bacterium]|nr:hypothetical protein [Verrucomicrobiales bacterium]
MKIRFLMVALVGLTAVPGGRAEDADQRARREAVAREKWSQAIAALRAEDEGLESNPEAILFLGSSSIRLWETMPQDMAPYAVIRRGYGGAKFADLAVFAEDLIRPHAYRAVVIFVGNDITGSESDAAVEDVVAWFREIAAVSAAVRPGAPIFLLGVTPTMKRWQAWPQIWGLNEALKGACETEASWHYVATSQAFLGADEKPREEYFRADHLHLSPLGYQVWAGIIKSHLQAVLGTPKP